MLPDQAAYTSVKPGDVTIAIIVRTDKLHSSGVKVKANVRDTPVKGQHTDKMQITLRVRGSLFGH